MYMYMYMYMYYIYIYLLVIFKLMLPSTGGAISRSLTAVMDQQGLRPLCPDQAAASSGQDWLRFDQRLYTLYSLPLSLL